MGEQTFEAMIYMYFVAFGGGMGLLTAAGIGFKLYKRSNAKKQISTSKRSSRQGKVV